MVQHGRVSRARVQRGFIAGFLIGAGLVTAACNRMPLLAPSGSAIRLVASATALSADGATDITAVVIEGGQSAESPDETGSVIAGAGTPVHDGTLVYFLTSIGRVEPSEARTKGGRATVRLFADGRAGTATVTAMYGGAVSTIEVDIGAATATRIALSASPQGLPSGGGTSIISARVEDQQGNGISGVVVTFSTTRGTLNPATAVTNAQGLAQTTLTTTGEATVTATSGGTATTLRGTITVTLNN
jgi:hypothetical protein